MSHRPDVKHQINFKVEKSLWMSATNPMITRPADIGQKGQPAGGARVKVYVIYPLGTIDIYI